jgi:hypothetical protein
MSSMTGRLDRTLLAMFAAAAIWGPVAAAPAPTPASASGDWVFHVDWGPALRYDMLCHLADDAGKVAGACQGFAGQVNRAAGAMDSRTLSFEYQTNYRGYDLTVRFDGRRDALGFVSGQVSAAGTPGAFTGAPVAGFASDQSSAWTMHVHMEGGPDYDLFCAFKLKGRQLTGPCVTAGGPVMTPAGAFADGKLSFSYVSVYQGVQGQSRFDGAFQPNGAIAGSTSSDAGGAGLFTARRQ